MKNQPLVIRQNNILSTEAANNGPMIATVSDTHTGTINIINTHTQEVRSFKISDDTIVSVSINNTAVAAMVGVCGESDYAIYTSSLAGSAIYPSGAYHQVLLPDESFDFDDFGELLSLSGNVETAVVGGFSNTVGRDQLMVYKITSDNVMQFARKLSDVVNKALVDMNVKHIVSVNLTTTGDTLFVEYKNQDKIKLLKISVKNGKCQDIIDAWYGTDEASIISYSINHDGSIIVALINISDTDELAIINDQVTPIHKQVLHVPDQYGNPIIAVTTMVGNTIGVLTDRGNIVKLRSNGYQAVRSTLNWNVATVTSIGMDAIKDYEKVIGIYLILPNTPNERFVVIEEKE